jgi:hypothetical protein
MNVKPTHSRLDRTGNITKSSGQKYENKVYDIEMN